MPSLPIKERKAKTPSFLVPLNKYIIIEAFKGEQIIQFLKRKRRLSAKEKNK